MFTKKYNSTAIKSHWFGLVLNQRQLIALSVGNSDARITIIFFEQNIILLLKMYNSAAIRKVTGLVSISNLFSERSILLSC